MNLEVGDKVRTTYRREKFDREYGQKFSGEVFTVASRQRRYGIPIYKLEDWEGEPIKGTFYQQQLQKVDVTDEDAFKVDIVDEDVNPQGQRVVKVHYRHWPKKFDRWMNADDLEDI